MPCDGTGVGGAEISVVGAFFEAGFDDVLIAADVGRGKDNAGEAFLIAVDGGGLGDDAFSFGEIGDLVGIEVDGFLGGVRELPGEGGRVILTEGVE